MVDITDPKKILPFSVTSPDREVIALREFLQTEIARLFLIPPHMIRSLDRAAAPLTMTISA